MDFDLHCRTSPIDDVLEVLVVVGFYFILHKINRWFSWGSPGGWINTIERLTEKIRMIALFAAEIYVYLINIKERKKKKTS